MTSITAVCDIDHVRANALVARFGIPHIFRKDDDVFKSDLIDAIIICTPIYLHETQAIAAMEAGRHVLVEKLLALSAEAVERVIAVADGTGRTLMVAMNNRCRPDTVALRLPRNARSSCSGDRHARPCHDLATGPFRR